MNTPEIKPNAQSIGNKQESTDTRSYKEPTAPTADVKTAAPASTSAPKGVEPQKSQSAK